MYVLLQGEIDIFVGDFVPGTVGPGALLGELALVDDVPELPTPWRRARRAWWKSTAAAFTFLFNKRRILRRM